MYLLDKREALKVHLDSICQLIAIENDLLTLDTDSTMVLWKLLNGKMEMQWIHIRIINKNK